MSLQELLVGILIFSVLVIVHELGHFLLAKYNKITVTEFSVGMGPRLLSHEWGGTLYSLKLLPFGGSCMMVGEDEENDEEGSFSGKPVWARIAVVAAGPVFNFLLGAVLAVLLVSSLGYDDTVVDVTPGYPAAQAGMQDGDRIVRMGKSSTYLYREISMFNLMHQGETAQVTYERDGQRYTVTLTPRQDESGSYRYGFVKTTGRTKGTLLQTLLYSAAEVRYQCTSVIDSLRMMLSGRVGLNDVSGPVGIVTVIGDVYEANRADGWYYVILSMINITLLLTVNLGVVNLLPIPALDGGRLVFLAVEALRGRAVPQEIEGRIHFAGLMLLMGLMLIILINDVRNII